MREREREREREMLNKEKRCVQRHVKLDRERETELKLTLRL